MNSKDVTTKLERVEAAMKRWHTKLTRATNELNKLRRKRERLMKQKPLSSIERRVGLGPLKPETVAALEAVEARPPSLGTAPEEVIPAAIQPGALDDIPTFLKRDPNADALKAMNRRIEERAAKRKPKKPAKDSPLLAKAVAESEARDRK